MPQSFTVATQADLASALAAIDAGGADSYTLEFSADVTLTAGALPTLTNAGATIVINGNGHVLDGSAAQSGFVVEAGTASLTELVIQNAIAAGGAGGSGATGDRGGGGGGGGGGGLGGGLFVGAAASVTLQDVSFVDDRAVGGNGGQGNGVNDTVAGSGGGLAGGAGGQGYGSGGVGGGLGGGGGGGVGPQAYSMGQGPAGTAGGFGGGGGGAGNGGTSSSVGSTGGFGGGGGGGLVFNSDTTTPRNTPGGFGGGEGSFDGGGGLGAGGDIFVQEGGSLLLAAGSLSGAFVTGGTSRFGGSGSAYGSGLFIQGSSAVTLAPTASGTLTISDVIADQSGSGGTGTNAGAGSLVIHSDGSGTVSLTATNTYTGGTTAETVVLAIGSDAALGNDVGSLTLRSATLQLDANVSLSRAVELAGLGATIDTGSNAVTLAGPVSGSSGGLFKVGTGTLTLAGVNTYSGGTTLIDGVLELASTGASNGGFVFAAGADATLRIDAAAALTIPSISGFARGEIIDLASLDYVAGSTAATLNFKLDYT